MLRLVGVLIVCAVVLAGCARAGQDQVTTSNPGQPETQVGVEETTASQSVSSTVESSAVDGAEESKPPAKPKPKPSPSTADDGERFLALKKVWKSGATTQARVDFLQLFTGDEAWKVAAKHGDEAPNDYYIVNENPKLRTFPFKPGTKITVALFDPSDTVSLTQSQWRAYFGKDPSSYPEGSQEYQICAQINNSNYFFTIKNGQVIKAKTFWVP